MTKGNRIDTSIVIELSLAIKTGALTSGRSSVLAGPQQHQYAPAYPVQPQVCRTAPQCATGGPLREGAVRVARPDAKTNISGTCLGEQVSLIIFFTISSTNLFKIYPSFIFKNNIIR